MIKLFLAIVIATLSWSMPSTAMHQQLKQRELTGKKNVLPRFDIKPFHQYPFSDGSAELQQEIEDLVIGNSQKYSFLAPIDKGYLVAWLLEHNKNNFEEYLSKNSAKMLPTKAEEDGFAVGFADLWSETNKNFKDFLQANDLTQLLKKIDTQVALNQELIDEMDNLPFNLDSGSDDDNNHPIDETTLPELLKKGASVIQRSKYNGHGTPLTIAAQKGHRDLAELLIDKGADLEAKVKSAYNSYYGKTPLLSAVEWQNYDVVQLLIERGANINAISHDGCDWLEEGTHTALTIAAYNGDYEIAQLLISKGADINPKTDDGSNPLAWAVIKNNYDVAELLIDNGAQIEAKYDGETPLMIAVYNGHHDVAELLIDSSANINAQNNDGETALDIANHRWINQEIITLLNDHGAKTKNELEAEEQARANAEQAEEPAEPRGQKRTFDEIN